MACRSCYTKLMIGNTSRLLYERISISAIYAVSASLLLLLWFTPSIAAHVGFEDGPVEALSALLLLVASLAMAIRATRLLARGSKNLPVALIAFAVALAFFVFAGEEISWGQRILGIETGEFLEQYNWQNELNLHNLQTDVSNVGYHYGAFLFLIILPIFAGQIKRLIKNTPLMPLGSFIAPQWLAIPSFAILGMIDPRFIYVIEKPWAAMLYLLALYVGLVLLGWQLLTAARRKEIITVHLLLLSLLLISLGLFVSYLQTIDQSPNTISEYKELVIAIGLMLFALQWRGTGQKTKRSKASKRS